MNKAKVKQKNYNEVKLLVENNPVSKKYFFDNIGSDWFKSLEESDAFQPNISLSKITDDGYYQDWIEGRYLSRISSELPQQVYDVIVALNLENHTNPLLYEIITEIIANVADRVDITKMIEKIVDDGWIGKKGRTTFMSFKLKDLMSKLITRKDFVLLSELLKTLLKFDLPSDYLESSKKRFIDPIPLIEVYSLEEILQEISKIDFENKSDINLILNILVASFDKYLELSKDLKEYNEKDPCEDYSFIWKSAIEYDKDRLHDIKEDFVVSIRDLLINNISIVDSDTFDILSKSNKRIFTRIRLFIFSKANVQEDIVINEIKENIEDRYNIHELRQLLTSRFSTFSEKNKSEILSKIGDSYANLEIDEKLKIQYKSELLKPISTFLTDGQKKQYKNLIRVEHEYTPSYQFGGMRSGPNSRYSKEQLLGKSHEQLTKIFIEDQHWFEENIHNEEMYSPRGLGRLWQTIVSENYQDYQENLKTYDPSKILPLYVYHLLNGIEEVTSKDTKVKWNKILRYLEDLLKKYEEDCFLESKVKDSFEVGDKEEVILSLLRLLENGFKGKNLIPISLKDKVWSIIKKVYTLANDIDESFVEKNDKDYFTHSINSIGGMILHNVYYYGFWVINKRKLKTYPQEVTVFLSAFLDSHLGYKTGVSVMGKYLPWTNRYDTSLFNLQKEKLLPLNDKDLRYVTWETYLANTIFEKPYQELREIYIQSIDELDQDIPERRYWADPKNTLLEHIMVGYIHKLDDSLKGKNLFQLLLDTKSTKHIAYAVDFVGRSYSSSDNEKKKNLSIEQIHRIKQIWHIVLDNCEDTEIFENFGWWIKNDYYQDNQWMLEMLNKTLVKSSGYIDPDFKVLEQLNLMASDYPLLVAKALDKMVKSSKKEKTYYFRDKEVSLILEKLENEENEDLQILVKDIRDTLVGYGYTQYAK